MNKKLYTLTSDDSEKFTLQFGTDIVFEKGTKLMIEGLFIPLQVQVNPEKFTKELNNKFFYTEEGDGKFLFQHIKTFRFGADFESRGDPGDWRIVTDWVDPKYREQPCFVYPLHDPSQIVKIKMGKYIWAIDNDDFPFSYENFKKLTSSTDSEQYLTDRAIIDRIYIVEKPEDQKITVSFPDSAATVIPLFSAEGFVHHLILTVNHYVTLETLDKYVNLSQNTILSKLSTDNNVKNFTQFYNYIKNEAIKVGIAIAQELPNIQELKNKVEWTSGALLCNLTSEFFNQDFAIKKGNRIINPFLSLLCGVNYCYQSFNSHVTDTPDDIDSGIMDEDNYSFFGPYYMGNKMRMNINDSSYIKTDNTTLIRWVPFQRSDGRNQVIFYTSDQSIQNDSTGINPFVKPICHYFRDELSYRHIVRTHAKCAKFNEGNSYYWSMLNLNMEIFRSKELHLVSFAISHDCATNRDDVFKVFSLGEIYAENFEKISIPFRQTELVREWQDIRPDIDPPFKLPLTEIWDIPIDIKELTIFDLFKLLDKIPKKDSIFFVYGQNFIPINTYSQLNDYALLAAKSNYLCDIKNSVDPVLGIKRSKLWIDFTNNPLVLNITETITRKTLDITVLNEEGESPVIFSLFQNLQLEMEISNFYPYFAEPENMSASRLLLIGQNESNGKPYDFVWTSNNRQALSFVKYVRLVKFFLEPAPETLTDNSLNIRINILSNVNTIDSTYGLLYYGSLSTSQPYSLDPLVDAKLGTKVSQGKLIEYADRYPSYTETINSLANTNTLDEIAIKFTNYKGEPHTWIKTSPILLLEIF